MKRIFVSLLVAAVGSLVALGLHLGRPITPAQDRHVTMGLGSDGWLEQGATFSFPYLLERGNLVSFSFDPWRPHGRSPAVLEFSVCGIKVHEINLRERQTTTVHLTGACQPRVVTITARNPLDIPGVDTRLLTARLVSAELSSRVGLPMPDGESLLIVTSLLLLLGVVFGRWGGWGLTVVVGGVLVVALAPFGELASSVGWMVLAISLGIGVHVRSSRYRFRSEGSRVLSPLGEVFALLLITAGACLLRLWGLRFGLPESYHPDEVNKVSVVLRMIEKGDPHPRYFLHPTQLLYWTAGLALLARDLFGFEMTRELVQIAGRTVSLIAGTLSVPLVFIAARPLVGSSGALMGTAAFAGFPLAVTSSRYLKEDALLLFWILVVIALTITALAHRRPKLLLLAGCAVGCATGSKYSGILTVVMVAAAPWWYSRTIVPDPRALLWAGFGLLLAPLCFVLTTPYSVLDTGAFLGGVLYEKSHMLKGHQAPIFPGEQLWMYHGARSLPESLTVGALLLSVVGCGVLLHRRSWMATIPLCVLALFYLPAEWVRAKPAPQPERYILPMLPMLAVALGALTEEFRAHRRMGALAALFFVAVIIPWGRSLMLASSLSPDTRELMAEAIQDQIPPGSTIMIDWRPYSPQRLSEQYRIRYPSPSRVAEEIAPERLAAEGVQYLLVSSLFYDRYFSQPGYPRFPRRVYEELFSTLPKVIEIVPSLGSFGFHNPRLTLFKIPGATTSDAPEVRLHEELAEGME